jgi:hypothetical protein
MILDLTGRRFGRWTVLALHPQRARYGRKTVHVLWLCRCDCGTDRLVTTSGLHSGHTTQCERCRREQAGELLRRRNTTHGLSKSRAFQCWANMLQRCLNPNHPKYADYGGRGVGPTDNWLRFENFYADMGDPPPGKSLDRINVDGNYEKANCKWSTAREQILNRRPPKKRKARRADLAQIQKFAASLTRAASASSGVRAAS